MRLHPSRLWLRRVLPLLAILLAFSHLVAMPAAAEPRTVVVGIYENPPKVFTSSSGKPSGIFVDVIEAVARLEGWHVRYVRGSWYDGLERLARGELDLMSDVAYTADREQQFSFNKVPVLSVWSQVYARKGSGIQTPLDLNGKRVAVLEHTVQLEEFQRLAKNFNLKINFLPVADYDTEFKMISSGKADAGLTNRLYGLMYARSFGLEDTPIIFDPAPFFFAAPRQAPPDLLQAIDRDLSKLKRDPKSPYYASLQRWTSEEVQFRLPVWVEIVALVLGVALVLSLVGGLVLKQQVKARTAELVKINAELAESEKRYRHLFEHNPAPMLIYQRGALKMLAVNDAFVNHYGYSREQALAMLLTDLYPQNEKEGIARVAAGLQGHAYAGEWHHRKADGTVITIHVRSHDIEYWGMNARVAVISDVTETTRMEKELREVNETLDLKVRERTAELTQMNIELAAANEKLLELDALKSMFIASMSHELRTPLNSIIGFTGILLQGWAGPLNEEQKKQLGMVKGSSQHLLELITDIIDISKIEAGKISLEMESFDLARTAREVLDTFQVAAAKKCLSLEVRGREELVVCSDTRRIKQVLVNLIGNAVKFTDRGSICVDVRQEGGEAVVAVCDCGVGIKAEDMGKLFRHFSQIPGSGKQEGTGLGLYISRKLMNLLGGDIHVESEFGVGSTFSIHLPAGQRGVL